MELFYSAAELIELGFGDVGDKVQISRRASIYNPSAISLGSEVRIDDFCILSGGKGICIGNYVHIAPYTVVYGGSRVVMEDYTGLSAHCAIFSESDDFSGNSMVHPFFSMELKPGYIRGEVVLRKFVQIGVHSTVLPGVELGEGVAVGAHSLVSKSCDPWGVYVGVPAKRVKERSQKLLDLERQFSATKSK